MIQQLLLLTFSFFYLTFEYVRWQQVGKYCDFKWNKNNNLIHSETCANPDHYSEEMQRMCHRARLDVQHFDKFHCNMEDFWYNIWIVLLAQLFVHNHWLLFGVVVVPMCFLIYKSFDSCRQLREEERQEKMFDKLVQLMPKNVPKPATPLAVLPETNGLSTLAPDKKRKLYISGEMKYK